METVDGVPGGNAFEQAVFAAMLRWDPIKFVANEGIRGTDTVDIIEWMVGLVVEFAGRRELEPTDLEDYLLQIMEAEFSLVTAPDAATFLVRQIIQFKADTACGGTVALRDYVAQTVELPLFNAMYGSLRMGTASHDGGGSGDAAASAAAHVADMAIDDDNDADGHGGGAIVDDDGWETVTKKKKK